MRYLFRTFAAAHTTTKDGISQHNWNVSKRVVVDRNYRTPYFTPHHPQRANYPPSERKSADGTEYFDKPKKF
jgi:hypothetical protein